MVVIIFTTTIHNGEKEISKDLVGNSFNSVNKLGNIKGKIAGFFDSFWTTMCRPFFCIRNTLRPG